MAGMTWSFQSWRLFLESFSETGSPRGLVMDAKVDEKELKPTI
jgi:hypothetical protein